MENLQKISSIKDVLLQEMDCFRYILSETKKVIESDQDILDNEYSLSRIEKLLDSRERYIEQLKRLEEYKAQFAFTEKDHYEIKEEIAKVARTLVDIDAKLLDYLQMKKMSKVKEIMEVTDYRNKNLNKKLNDFEKSKIIDIKQE